MEKTKVGVVGLGLFAHQAILPALVEAEGVELTACMARTRSTVDRVVRRYGFKHGFTSLDQMIEGSGVEAVFVVTPKQTHHDIVLNLLSAGMHVYTEKPLASSVPEAEDLIQCADENEKTLMVGFNRRFLPVYEEAKKYFSEKTVEACVTIKNRPGTEYRSTIENTIHMVDLLRWFCGECIEVESYTRYDDPYYETSISAILKFDSGAIASLFANRTCGQWTERLELYGGGRSVMVDCPNSVTLIDSELEHTMKVTPLRMGMTTALETMGYQKEVLHFIECVRTGQEPRSSGREALKTQILIDKILSAAGLPLSDAN